MLPTGPHEVGRRVSAAQAFFGEKSWRKAEFISAAQVKLKKGSREAAASWEGNMLPAMFLPIAYIPVVGWLGEVFARLF